MTTRPPTAVIADDERLMREQLRARLAEVWPELAIVAEAKNGTEAVELVQQHHPDLVFLDIRMPGMTGVEGGARDRAIAHCGRRRRRRARRRLARLRDRVQSRPTTSTRSRPSSRVSSTTCSSPQSANGWAVTADRVRQRLARRLAPARDDAADAAPAAAGMQQLLQKLARQLNPNAPAPLRWIQASVGQSIQMIPVEEVLFFISDEKYTRVQTATLEALIRKPIKELVDELDADTFWQIHRSTLVNARAIAGVSRDERGRQLVAVRGRPEKLEVSRSYSGLFKGM